MRALRDIDLAMITHDKLIAARGFDIVTANDYTCRACTAALIACQRDES